MAAAEAAAQGRRATVAERLQSAAAPSRGGGEPAGDRLVIRAPSGRDLQMAAAGDCPSSHSFRDTSARSCPGRKVKVLSSEDEPTPRGRVARPGMLEDARLATEVDAGVAEVRRTAP